VPLSWHIVYVSNEIAGHPDLFACCNLQGMEFEIVEDHVECSSMGMAKLNSSSQWACPMTETQVCGYQGPVRFPSESCAMVQYLHQSQSQNEQCQRVASSLPNVIKPLQASLQYSHDQNFTPNFNIKMPRDNEEMPVINPFFQQEYLSQLVLQDQQTRGHLRPVHQPHGQQQMPTPEQNLSSTMRTAWSHPASQPSACNFWTTSDKRLDASQHLPSIQRDSVHENSSTRDIPADSIDADTLFTIFPRRRGAEQMSQSAKDPVRFTKKRLDELFKYPIIEAAQSLGISTTALKTLCHNIGINKWPYRSCHGIKRRCKSSEQQEQEFK